MQDRRSAALPPVRSGNSFPRLLINVRKLEHNARLMVEEFAAAGITVMGVNKVFNGLSETAEAVVRGGIQTIAESRIANLKKLAGLPVTKCLLRSPAPSEVDDTVRFSDLSLESEESVLRALSAAAVRQNRTHEVMLMIDMGDLREGIWHEDRPSILRALDLITTLPGLNLYGLGTNFNCYGTLLPTRENGLQFVTLARELEAARNIRFPYLSGGNCTSHYLLRHGLWPEGINHLRVGGTHEFGIEYVNVEYLEGYYHSSMDVKRVCSDLYLLQAEVIETNVKPTCPVGKLGRDAFLQTKTFVDRGPRRRALLAVGRQDIPHENLWPCDPGITVLGQTSDHTLIDTQDAVQPPEVGEIVSFQLDYTGLLHACNAPGIEKVVTHD
ncbi:MAG TPA: alanine/ornithine racemase family PLP-dependent enzyme [Candidatus Ozemobacteraceae bacterium]|nr:alanine/ornithine racemase family PLP-dependent enzyme [Candidatus Ozemobacteraceae bacterium]